MPTFETPEPVAVIVEILSGEVTVAATDRTDTVVTVRPANESAKGDSRAAEQTRIDFTAGTLRVITPRDWRTYTPFGGNPSIVVTIEVPTGSRLKGTTAVGRMMGTGELGRCDLEVAAGDIVVERPADSVTAKTAKGDIRIGEAVRGELRLETSMGELEVGIGPGSAVRLEAGARHGTVLNRMQPAGPAASNGELVRVYAHNSYGDIIVRHASVV
ncbi:hypothetical protein ACWDT6_24515 [Nocardia grenadensis]|uniref:hypothetical protein n=2 Tax=Nocardia grenadensis TaxID=931537 RepID=UPI003D716B5A